MSSKNVRSWIGNSCQSEINQALEYSKSSGPLSWSVLKIGSIEQESIKTNVKERGCINLQLCGIISF